MSQQTPNAVVVFSNQRGDVTLMLYRLGQPTVNELVKLSISDSQSLLIRLFQFLDVQHLPVGNLAGVVVVPGDARFTVSRLTAVVANTIAWSMHIPVVEATSAPGDAAAALQLIRQGTPGVPVVPRYSREPRITM